MERLGRAGARLLVAAMVVFGSTQANASPVLVEVDYLTTHGQSCVRSFCVPLTPGVTFAKSFTLDSAQLGVDGLYDVAATLTPAFVFPPGTTSSALSVLAVVSSGAVTDLRIHFYESASVTVPILGTTYSSQAFDASAGAWSGSSSSSSSLSYGSGSSGGTYTVTMVPEPASLALVALGLLALGRGSRR